MVLIYVLARGIPWTNGLSCGWFLYWWAEQFIKDQVSYCLLI